MKKINKLSLLLPGIILLASCSGFNEIREKQELLVPEQFINERKGGVERTVALGPKADLTKAGEVKSHQRRRINKEEQKNYIDVDNADENVFHVTMNFENVGIRDAISMISEVTGRNILVSDEVSGKVNARLIDVPWDKALGSVLKTKGLAKHVDSDANIIRIHKQDVLVAQEEFDRKRVEDMQKTIAAQRAVEPLYTDIFRLYYTDTTTVKSEIEGVLGIESGEGGDSSTSGKVEITVDERINSLIVKATEDELNLIARLIDEIDVRTKQILIEAFIVEATDDFTKELGARLGYDNTSLLDTNLEVNDFSTGIAGVAGSQAEAAGVLTLGDSTGTLSNLPVSGAYGGIGVLLKSSAASLKVELTALEKDGITKILSNPRIFTLDNEEAVIIQGDEIPYKSEAEGGGTDIEFKEAGVKLTVTPSIVGDGNVILDVVVEKKSADTSQDNPPITTREITTKLLVQDRSIVVIGGVFTQETTDTEQKVPFFGDIPVVGKLFRYEKDADVRKELLVFLAPRVI